MKLSGRDYASIGVGGLLILTGILSGEVLVSLVPLAFVTLYWVIWRADRPA